jgi:hypothetical protein
MPYYRIEINELNNGEKNYRVQCGYLYTSGGWIKKQEIRWDYMFESSFDTEREALELIEGLKKWDATQEGKKVKSTTYKVID